MSLELPTSTPVLDGPRVRLRALEPGDRAGRQRLGLDPDIIRSFGGTPGAEAPQPMPDQVAQGWYESMAADPNPLHWVVEHDGRFLGSTRLHQADPVDRHARYGIGLFDAAKLGQGLGTEVTELVLAYGFDHVGLHRVDLLVLAGNTRAIACYRRCGFVEEGRLRETACVDGVWQDDLVMGVLARDLADRPSGASGRRDDTDTAG
jgi:[ribosomal protein S5]-alanine N-acetyltransferase